MLKDICDRDIIVVEQACPPAFFDFLKYKVEHPDVQWTWIPTSAYGGHVEKALNDPQLAQYDVVSDFKSSFAHVVKQYGGEIVSPLFDICFAALLCGASRVEGLGVQEVKRIRVGMHTANESKIVNGPHIDTAESSTLAALLYLCDSDGETVFYRRWIDDDSNLGLEIADTNLNDYSVVECKENRLVIFDANRLHASTKQTTPARRCVINYNFR